MRDKHKLLSIIMVVLGVIILLIPSYRDWKSDQRTKDIIANMRDIEEQASDVVEEQLAYQGRVIKADKIDLLMPIANGATFENMIDNVATIKHDKIEDGKNFSIAGHRYIRHGRHFNRLDELHNGDVITVIDEGKEYNYKVFDKMVVEPSDISVLDDSGKTELTLITCHPPGISSHRLIIKGEMIDE